MVEYEALVLGLNTLKEMGSRRIVVHGDYEYEALVLGLKTLKEMGARRMFVHGDFELIINRVKGIYQAKHPRLREYRNIVLDLLEEFS
jgi:ribonuclease HI